MMYMAVIKRDPEIDMFLDMREEERLQEDERLSYEYDKDDTDWMGGLCSCEALVDEIDRLNDLYDNMDHDFVYDLD